MLIDKISIVLNTTMPGAPGWLSQLSAQLLISAPVLISGLWVQAPCWAPHSVWTLIKKILFSAALKRTQAWKRMKRKKVWLHENLWHGAYKRTTGTDKHQGPSGSRSVLARAHIHKATTQEIVKSMMKVPFFFPRDFLKSILALFLRMKIHVGQILPKWSPTLPPES